MADPDVPPGALAVGVGNVLVPVAEAARDAPVPLPEADSAFTRYCRSKAPLAVGAQLVGAAAIVGSCTAALLVAGPAACLGAVAVGTPALLWVFNRTPMFGNRELEQELRDRLDGHAPALEFVGLGQPGSNTLRVKLGSVRVETDDNVGLLELSDTALSIRMDGSTLLVEPGSIHRIELERMVELPLLSWIRLELEHAEGDTSILVTSRQASSLRGARRATRRLYERLIDWHAERQLAWLDQARFPGGEPAEPPRSTRSTSSAES